MNSNDNIRPDAAVMTRKFGIALKYPIPEHSRSPYYELSDDTLIGQGNKRDCHAHPEDPNLCIKVARHPDNWRECHQQSVVEWYYLSHLRRRRVPFDHLVDCHGWVQTSRGSGLVLERVRDDEGSAAPTLGDALARGQVNELEAFSLLSTLRAWALKHAVAIADLNTANLMLRQRAGRRELVLVDGIGSRRAEWKFTLYQIFPALSRRKTRREWKHQGEGLARAIRGLSPGGSIREHADATG
jgi:hypothetical protein